LAVDGEFNVLAQRPPLPAFNDSRCRIARGPQPVDVVDSLGRVCPLHQLNDRQCCPVTEERWFPCSLCRWVSWNLNRQLCCQKYVWCVACCLYQVTSAPNESTYSLMSD
jgi:hypothetical protein